MVNLIAIRGVCLRFFLVLCCLTSFTSIQANALTFAAIGDYGDAGNELNDVANLIRGWNPEFIITMGDNDYDGDYTQSVLPYFGDYISSNCAYNRFYPSFGNHDWFGNRGYDDVFPCTGTRYKFKKGNTEFFTVNSDSMSSSQATWLKTSLRNSTATWKIVFFHHAPFSSGRHGNSSFMNYDYAGWGADVVIAGHDHSYERIERNGIVYLVNGLGGKSRYGFDNCCVSGSKVRYNSNYGAIRFDVNGDTMRVRFITRTPTVRDDFTLRKSNSGGGNPGNTEVFTGSLSGAKDYDNHPKGSYIKYDGGTLDLSLSGPSNADFDLILKRWNGSFWSDVAKAETSSSDERITYRASSGYYYYRVYSYSGSGSYRLTVKK